MITSRNGLSSSIIGVNSRISSYKPLWVSNSEIIPITFPERARISSALEAFFDASGPHPFTRIDGKSSSINAIEPCFNSPLEYASE